MPRLIPLTPEEEEHRRRTIGAQAVLPDDIVPPASELTPGAVVGMVPGGEYPFRLTAENYRSEPESPAATVGQRGEEAYRAGKGNLADERLGIQNTSPAQERQNQIEYQQMIAAENMATTRRIMADIAAAQREQASKRVATNLLRVKAFAAGATHNQTQAIARIMDTDQPVSPEDMERVRHIAELEPHTMTGKEGQAGARSLLAQIDNKVEMARADAEGQLRDLGAADTNAYRDAVVRAVDREKYGRVAAIAIADLMDRPPAGAINEDLMKQEQRMKAAAEFREQQARENFTQDWLQQLPAHQRDEASAAIDRGNQDNAWVKERDRLFAARRTPIKDKQQGQQGQAEARAMSMKLDLQNQIDQGMVMASGTGTKEQNEAWLASLDVVLPPDDGAISLEMPMERFAELNAGSKQNEGQLDALIREGVSLDAAVASVVEDAVEAAGPGAFDAKGKEYLSAYLKMKWNEAYTARTTSGMAVAKQAEYAQQKAAVITQLQQRERAATYYQQALSQKAEAQSRDLKALDVRAMAANSLMQSIQDVLGEDSAVFEAYQQAADAWAAGEPHTERFFAEFNIALTQERGQFEEQRLNMLQAADIQDRNRMHAVRQAQALAERKRQDINQSTEQRWKGYIQSGLMPAIAYDEGWLGVRRNEREQVVDLNELDNVEDQIVALTSAHEQFLAEALASDLSAETIKSVRDAFQTKKDELAGRIDADVQEHARRNLRGRMIEPEALEKEPAPPRQPVVITAEEISDARDWLRDNPDDPRADTLRALLPEEE